MSSTKNFSVTGMSCGHCESAVRSELEELNGISAITVSAAEGDLSVTLEEGASVSNQDIINAVDEAGYTAEAVA
ncbi:heavy-metal-associated domain-containing protein [Nesterenkonia sp. MY13]|uniref:Heavy-metal-associated domain-containing protein n=1 Tax=Nesterenkonia sedimenti TaxID=1463632 RepID=A0A7X8TIS3_9MICC|nr:heavy-metal-associated domain-containing protein [Nesterenkonia sedimenti]NLS09316.1 heavy-metal-associated domain-containing protein [Nesterenkonia sedimenti]